MFAPLTIPLGAKRRLALLNAVAALALLLALVDLGVRLRDYRSAWSAAPSAVPTAPAAPAAPRYRIDDIIAAHLFGLEVVTGSAKTAAPETRLNLVLQGVLANTDPRHSRAIIAVNAEPPKTYAIGQILENTDARLRTIEHNLVLIERNGVLESVPLLRGAQDNAPRTPGPLPPALEATRSASPSPPAPAAIKPVAAGTAAPATATTGKPAAAPSPAGTGQQFPFGGAQE